MVTLALGAAQLLADATGMPLFSAGGLAVLLVALGLGNIAAFVCTEMLARRARR